MSTPPGSPRKRIILTAVIALYLIMELTLGLAGHFFFQDHFDISYQRLLRTYVDALPDDVMTRWVKERSDPIVGWKMPPSISGAGEYGRSPLGLDKNAPPGRWFYRMNDDASRHNPYPSNHSFIATFGDSFTFGSEANDNETFSYYLSELTGSNVLNFGVGGYDPTQAYLLAKNTVPKHHPQIVILAFNTENIARMLNVYRPFYTKEESSTLWFKPIALETGDGGYRYFHIPTVLGLDLSHRADVLRGMAEAENYDYWFQLYARPELKFPYALSYAKAIWRGFQRRDEPHLYQNPQAIGRFRHVLADFMTLAKAQGFTPVLVHIPNEGPLRDKDASNYQASPPKLFLNEVERDFPDLTVVDVTDAPFDTKAFNVIPYQFHCSAYGNKIVAQSIYGALLAKGLLGGERRPSAPYAKIVNARNGIYPHGVGLFSPEGEGDGAFFWSRRHSSVKLSYDGETEMFAHIYVPASYPVPLTISIQANGRQIQQITVEPGKHLDAVLPLPDFPVGPLFLDLLADQSLAVSNDKRELSFVLTKIGIR